MDVKGIILAAGYGTRFLPLTKTVPKELLPMGTRPSIHYIVEEYLKSGIREILIVNSRRKKAIEDYFDIEAELDSVFAREGKERHRELIAPPDARIYFARQPEMKGTGAAILLAREFAAGCPSVLAFPDDIHMGEAPLAGQLINVHQRTGGSVLALEHIPEPEDISRYGVAAVTDDPLGTRVTGIIEKPATGTEPSRYISVGRYLLAPEVFDVLARQYTEHTSGEFNMTGGFDELAHAGRLWGCFFSGERLDTGEPLGYYQAAVRFMLADPTYREPFAAFLRGLNL